MTALPKAFTERMARDLGDEAAAFFNCFSLPPVRGIRVNTLKISVARFREISPFDLSPVPWEPNGFYVSEEKPGKTVLHAAGAYYVQEPSAMCAAPLLGACPGERVLDLCSAPGGKGTQLAQAMRGEGVIVLNEINFQRAKALSSNVERLGITNAVVTCASPGELAEKLAGSFDRVLVDAPCSGEGMFRKDPAAAEEWSPANVKMCAARQAEILECAARLLAPGGRLVYSTCTFAREEDEERSAAFLAAHPSFSLEREVRLWPHRVRGEGHYAALFKSGGEGRAQFPALARPRADKRSLALFAEFSSRFLNVSFGNIHAVGNRLYSLPEDCPDPGVQQLRAGVELGEVIKDRFEPAHALAMCLREGQAAFIELDECAALSYLRGNTFACPDVSGWAVASYLGLPLGWCKVSGGTAKNHLPKALRI